jgi:hypothetical protein
MVVKGWDQRSDARRFWNKKQGMGSEGLIAIRRPQVFHTRDPSCPRARAMRHLSPRAVEEAG